MESELYVYEDTCKEILRIKNELLSASIGDPASQLMKHRMLEQMEKIADVIDVAIHQLPPEKQELIKLRYWTRPQLLTWDGVANHLKCDRSTAIRWRNEIITTIAVRMGWR